MPRRSTPLYEFMSRSPRSAGAPARRVPEPVEAPADDAPSALSRLSEGLGGGRILRIPMGYLFLGAAACLVLLILAYTVGHSRGESAATQLEQELLTGAYAPSNRPDDPLASSGGAQPGTHPGLLPPGLGRPEERFAGVTTPVESNALGPVESDPRSGQGLHYFVLATTKKEGAVRLAEFCRDHGLAAYVIPGNNPRFRRVIALPGLPSRSSSEVEQVRERIRRIGQAWKARHPGESDLADAYMIQSSG